MAAIDLSPLGTGLIHSCQKARSHTAEAGLSSTVQDNSVLCRNCRGKVGLVGLVGLGGSRDSVVVGVERLRNSLHAR